jgi:hypothetical protein
MKITLLVVVLAMEPVFVYVGFFAPRVFVRFSAQTAAFMLPLIAVARGYAIWQEATAVRRLAEHIDPYPGITSTLWVPPIPGTGAQHWLFETPDSRENVSSFYADEAHRRGWKGIEGAPGSFLRLRKGSGCLDVFASESTLGTQGRKTTIIYTLREECAGPGQPRSRTFTVIAAGATRAAASPVRRWRVAQESHRVHVAET